MSQKPSYIGKRSAAGHALAATVLLSLCIAPAGWAKNKRSSDVAAPSATSPAVAAPTLQATSAPATPLDGVAREASSIQAQADAWPAPTTTRAPKTDVALAASVTAAPGGAPFRASVDDDVPAPQSAPAPRTSVGKVELGLPMQLQAQAEGTSFQQGGASWYGPGFHNRRTANGERFDMHALTAAHRTLPFGTLIRVVTSAGKSVVVRINDRGPYAHGRIIDLSSGAAERLGLKGHGVMRVKLFRLRGNGKQDQIALNDAS